MERLYCLVKKKVECYLEWEASGCQFTQTTCAVVLEEVLAEGSNRPMQGAFL